MELKPYLFDELMSRGSVSVAQRRADSGYAEDPDLYERKLLSSSMSRSFADSLDLGTSISDLQKAENLSTVFDVTKTAGILHPIGRGAGTIIDVGVATYQAFYNSDFVKASGALVGPFTEALFKATTRGGVVVGEAYARGAAAFGESTSRAFNAGIPDKKPN